jgi:hypothetical protein
MQSSLLASLASDSNMKKIARESGSAPGQGRPSNLDSVLVLFGSLLCGGALSLWLGQDATWDLKNYHLYNGYAYINGRLGHDIAPAQLQTYHNPILDAACYLLLKHATPRIYGFVLGAVQAVNCWLVYEIAKTVFSGMSPRFNIRLSFLCAVLAFYGVVGISELGTTGHDLTTASFVHCAILLFLRTVNVERERLRFSWNALAAGFVLGLGVGLKLTLAVYALGFAGGFLVRRSSFRLRVRESLSWGAGLGAGVLSSAGPWMFRLYRTFGNPMFPYYNAVFESAYVEPVNFRDTAFVPKTVRQGLLFPFHFTYDQLAAREEPFQDLRFSIVYLLVLVALAAAVARWVAARVSERRSAASATGGPSLTLADERGQWLLAFFLLSYVGWQLQFAIYRYVAPLEQLAPILIVLLTARVVTDERQLATMTAVLFAIIASSLRVPITGRAPWDTRILEMVPPALRDPAKTTVVMTSWEPTSYVIPSFPAAVRFVRIESNFFHPDVGTKLAELVRGALGLRDRDYYLLTTPQALPNATGLLDGYGLKLIESACTKPDTPFGDPLAFCRLESAPASPDRVERVVFTAAPNPVRLCGGPGVSTLTWRTDRARRIQIRVGHPGGDLFAGGGAAGSATTGPWLARGTRFYLQDAEGDPTSPGNTLATVTVSVIRGPCP